MSAKVPIATGEHSESAPDPTHLAILAYLRKYNVFKHVPNRQKNVRSPYVLLYSYTELSNAIGGECDCIQGARPSLQRNRHATQGRGPQTILRNQDPKEDTSVLGT